VNSFQSRKVIGTIFKIENLDLHSFQTFLLYLPNGPSARQATAVMPKTNKQKYASKHPRQIRCGKCDVYCGEQIDRSHHIVMLPAASCGVANPCRGHDQQCRNSQRRPGLLPIQTNNESSDREAP
jgi:hypothetical protein